MRCYCTSPDNCTFHPRVDVFPQFESAENLAKLAVEHDDKGYFLRKREDGACVHLSDDGCTVYEHCPRGCRIYDCRPYSLIGMVVPYDNGHKAPIYCYDYHLAHSCLQKRTQTQEQPWSTRTDKDAA